MRAIDALLVECQRAILGRHPTVAGFNIAVNVGRAAGQTIAHCHAHPLPRRAGDGKGIMLAGPVERLIAAD